MRTVSTMNTEERIARNSEDIVRKEIASIAQAIGVGSDEELKQSAMNVAKSFLETNELAEPITLARASFYVALKKNRPHPEREVKSIIHNNGTPNRWWIYLVPIMEKSLTGR